MIQKKTINIIRIVWLFFCSLIINLKFYGIIKSNWLFVTMPLYLPLLFGIICFALFKSLNNKKL